MFYLVILQLFAYFNFSNSLQVLTKGGEFKWIASIDEYHDCNSVIKIIEKTLKTDEDAIFSMKEEIEMKEMINDVECFLSFSATKKMAQKIKNIDGVEFVEADEVIFSNKIPWNLDRIDQDKLPLNERYQSYYKGKSQTIYILDTGVFPEHEDVKGRVSIGKDFINEESKLDLNGHGTHCSGTAIGTKYGAAKQANVVGVKVLSKYGSGSISGIIQALQWVEKNANKKPHVISMSLGGGFNKALNKAAKDATKNAIVVVAAGNGNTDACKSSPAAAGGKGNVITVGSTTYGDRRSSFSSFGKCVDIFAPGSNILSIDIKSKKATSIKSGTSMATPLVAGVAAGFLEKHNGNVENARSDLLSSAVLNQLKGDIGKNSINNLLQTITEFHPPTPPTKQPSKPPIKPDPILKIDQKKIDHKISYFGNQDDIYNVDLEGQIIIPKKELMCEKTNQNFKDKIVLVTRGECSFYQKVKNCQKNGATGVIIKNDVNSVIFNPRYYGNSGDIKIPSCMISKNDGNKIKNNDDLIWGSNFLINPKPSFMPTVRPCDLVRKRRRCRRRSYCKWESENKKCIENI